MNGQPTDALRDIAPPIDYSSLDPWTAAAATAAAAIAVAALFLFLRRKKQAQTPPPTPEEIALRELAEVRRQIDSLDAYPLAIRASDILRSYLSRRHAIPATNQTSPEFLQAIASSPQFAQPLQESLASFLHSTDLVKFARSDASRDELSQLLDTAADVVKGTAP